MKKIMAIIMAISMMFLTLSATVLAEDDLPPVDGVIKDTWEHLLNSDSEGVYKAVAVIREGDANRDGSVTANDARECLQIVSGLIDPFYLPTTDAIDVNGDNEVTATDARIILQMVAGVTTVDTVVERTLGDSLFDGLAIGPLKGAGAYFWQCEFDEEGLDVSIKGFDNTQPGTIGGSYDLYYAFTPKKVGTYTITFKLAHAGDETDVIDEFKCVLTVKS